MKVKNDHRSKFSNLSNWKEEAWKKKTLHIIIFIIIIISSSSSSGGGSGSGIFS